MKKLSLLILVFSLAFGFSLIAPALLSQPFGPFPLVRTGEVVDIFTPLVLIPLYWLLLQFGSNRFPDLKSIIIFLVLAALWVEGQGMHLAANAIGHWLNGMQGSNAYQLTKFFDEILSHYLWHIGIIGLSTLLLYRQWQYPFTSQQAKLNLIVVAGVIYGITFFTIIIEAGTVPLGVPYAILVTLFGLIWGRDKLRQQPVLAFFLVGYGLAALLFAGWGIYWGGFPEFSEVGIIQ